ncbi:MAG TPA: TetR/AcrR family transcriptional regulator, partial [Euzebya sp.]|nr:TetR/AcrR family transcriptional regulator [Euzebya sp.]
MAGASPDPAQIIALLWGTRARPSRAGISVPAIVEVAVALADADGLDAVSMRAVADRAGVGTMTLYTHVPGKAELLMLMVDRVQGELYADVDEPTRQTGGWQGAMRFIAQRNLELLVTHVWLLELRRHRPVLGPNELVTYEAELRPLDGIGLDELAMDGVRSLVLAHVSGVARAAADGAWAAEDSGMSDDDWWQATAPHLEAIDHSPFPVASRVGQAAGERWGVSTPPEVALAVGLDRILAGVEA